VVAFHYHNTEYWRS